MKLTKKQKGYLAVLAVALAAFLGDRLFFLPAGADAASAEEDPRSLLVRPGGGANSSAVAAASALRNPYRVDLLGERLDDVAASHRLQLSGVRDAFVPSSAWVATPKAFVPDTGAEAVRAFREKYKLRAIFLSPGGNTAIINDRPYREGQRVGGFKLVTIGTRSTTLASGDQQVELLLDPVSSLNVE